MTTRTRIAITVAAALALAITNYGQAMSATDFGLRGDLWDWGAPAATVFAVIGVFLVNSSTPPSCSSWSGCMRRFSRSASCRARCGARANTRGNDYTGGKR
jgi:hypothetical protein